jgi:hypothetical protein
VKKKRTNSTSNTSKVSSPGGGVKIEGGVDFSIL